MNISSRDLGKIIKTSQYTINGNVSKLQYGTCHCGTCPRVYADEGDISLYFHIYDENDNEVASISIHIKENGFDTYINNPDFIEIEKKIKSELINLIKTNPR